MAIRQILGEDLLDVRITGQVIEALLIRTHGRVPIPGVIDDGTNRSTGERDAECGESQAAHAHRFQSPIVMTPNPDGLAKSRQRR